MRSLRRGMAFAVAGVAVLVSACGAEEAAPPAASVTSEDAGSAQALADAEQRAADAEKKATEAEAAAAEDKERVAELEDELASAEASLAELEEAAEESQADGGIEAETVAAVDEDDAADEDHAADEPEAAADQGSGSMTVAQENAVRSARSYLDFTAFSRSGLIGQLEFEGYSTADATAAVDSLDVDYNEQAAKSAKSYLEFTGFSRQGLIDQLVFEGYSQEQATYGVDQTGL